MACEEGSGAHVWMAMALSAALEYSRGVISASRGERRGSCGGCRTGVVGEAMGSLVADSIAGITVGAAVGAIGGVLLRVCL